MELDYQAFYSLMSVFLVLMSSVHGIDDQMCPDGMFLPVDDVLCHPCSSCASNLVIKEVCSGSHDTVCGPLRDFIFQQEYQVERDSNSQVNI